MALRAVVVGLLALVVEPLEARASDTSSRTDGSAGRLDGDLGVALAAGVTLGPSAPRAVVDGRLRYLSSAGVFVTYEDGPLVGASPSPRRALAFGFEVLPLFLGRWGTDRELGVPRVDLLIDSFALELGAVFVQPEGAKFASRSGLQAGLGLAVPVFPNTTGPFVGVHAGARWSERALSGGPLDGPSDRALYLTIVLGWHTLFSGHVVDDDETAAR